MEQRIVLRLLPGTEDHEAQIHLCLLSLGRGQALLSAPGGTTADLEWHTSGHHYDNSETMVSTDLVGLEFR